MKIKFFCEIKQISELAIFSHYFFFAKKYHKLQTLKKKKYSDKVLRSKQIVDIYFPFLAFEIKLCKKNLKSNQNAKNEDCRVVPKKYA